MRRTPCPRSIVSVLVREPFAVDLLGQPAGACSAAGGCCRASRAISARDRAPSLARMWETCVSTVLRDSQSSAAMSGLDCPSATSYAIFASVGVSAELPGAAYSHVVTQLDRLLAVMAQYARDGVEPAGTGRRAPVPTTDELTILGIPITLEQAAASMHLATGDRGTHASTHHPVAGRLGAAADCLLAGRDLLNTCNAGTSGYPTDPVWA